MLQTNTRRGELDRKITFIQEVITTGSANQDVHSWSVIAINPTVFCRKREQKGTETVVGDQLKYVQRTEFRIVYRDDLSVKNRVVFSGKVYEILSITEADEQRNSYLDVIANLIDNEVWT